MQPNGYALAGHRLPLPAVAGIGALAAVLVVAPRRAWRVGRLVITAVHESGHAAVAVLTGRRVVAVHLRADSSGVTYHRGRRRWAPSLLTAAAGYPAPGLVGDLGAWLTSIRQPRVWLILLLALGAVNLVLWIRNLFGFALMLMWVATIGWLAVEGGKGADAVVGAAFSWFLILGGLRAGAELLRATGNTDASDVGRLVHLPTVVCKLGFLAATAASAAGGAALLLARR